MISIHASRGGSDAALSGEFSFPNVFQSTLPAGEATLTRRLFLSLWKYFNPRFPRGKRHQTIDSFADACKISIHASRGGSDLPCFRRRVILTDFNPRFPRGKRHPSYRC